MVNGPIVRQKVSQTNISMGVFAEIIVNEKINEGMNALMSELISFKAKCSNSTE
jgi:hypothetical protein